MVVPDKFFIIAGPCAIENEDLFLDTLDYVNDSADIFRGMIFKPRSSPGSFQGIGEENLDEALAILKKAKEKYNKPIVNEVMEIKQIDILKDYVDIFQVGTRNSLNFSLLKALGKQDKPVILKRGFCATVEEWLGAAEYITNGGNNDVILCERGIRTFEKATRNTLDLGIVPLLKMKTDFKVIVDPSHSTGNKDLVIPMAKAAKACGADGIIVDTHIDPSQAKCDGPQALTKEMYLKMIEELNKI